MSSKVARCAAVRPLYLATGTPPPDATDWAGASATAAAAAARGQRASLAHRDDVAVLIRRNLSLCPAIPAAWPHCAIASASGQAAWPATRGALSDILG